MNGIHKYMINDFVLFPLEQKSDIGYINQHASNAPFFTALLMYFNILLLCHTWDYGYHYESLFVGAAQGSVYEELSLFFTTDLSLMLVGTLFFAFAFYSLLLYPESSLVSFDRQVQQTVLQPYVWDCHPSLDDDSFDEEPSVMETLFQEGYSDQLIQDHLNRNVPFQFPCAKEGPEGSEGAKEEALDFVHCYVLPPCMFLFTGMIWEGEGLSLLGLATKESLATSYAMGEPSGWGYEVGALLRERWGTLLAITLVETLGMFFSYFQDMVSDHVIEFWYEWSCLEWGFFYPEAWPVELWDIVGYHNAGMFHDMLPEDVFWLLVSPDWAAFWAVGSATTLFGSKVFLLVLGSGMAFLLGTYNGIYSLSVSDDSFMNKELNRIGHFHTETNIWFGFQLFLLTELLIFAGFFWALFFYMVVPSVAIGDVGPSPAGFPVMDPTDVPLVNTMLLVMSGYWLTWSHHLLARVKYKTNYVLPHLASKGV